MKSLFFSLLILSGINTFGQNSAGKNDDAARIALAAYVPEQIDNMPDAARSMLANKISQIVTENGLGGSALYERFIMTANVNVATKDITPTAPPMHAYTLDVTLYIGDGIDGTKFASYTTTVKGAGTNETKAYMSALGNLKAKDPKYQSFIETGKTKIMEYYNSKCDFIIKEAQTLAAQNQFDEAIYKLTSVPQISKGCYDKCMDAVAPIYKQKIDRECKMKITNANNIWAANQTVEAANEVGSILSTVEPTSSCFGEVKTLFDKVSSRAKELNDREWKFALKNQGDLIKAYRDVGVAYGNGQPKSVVYNVKGWW